MKRSVIMLLSAVLILFGLARCAQATASVGQIIEYPAARRNLSVVDNYHGTQVRDPYRWLEDPDSPETRAFVEAQNNVSRPFFRACPVRSNITERLTVAKDYPRYGCPRHAGGKYFYFHNTGLQDQDVMYMQDSLDSQPSVFLDPNTLSVNGTVALSYAEGFSKDGSLYAYSLSVGGSDWMTIKVRRVNDSVDLSDTVNHVKFSYMAWTPDNQGFFYSGYPGANGSDTGPHSNHSLFYHRVGTAQAEDTLVFDDPLNPTYLNFAETSEDGRYLVVGSSAGTSGNTVYIADLLTFQQGGSLGPLALTEVINNFDDEYWYITNNGREFIFLTNKDAAFQRLIRINISNPQQDTWVTLVPQNSTKGLLKYGKAVNGKLLLHYLQEAKSELYVCDLFTGTEEYQVPLNMGSVGCMSGQTTDTQLFFSFQSLLEPGTVYILDIVSFNTTVWMQSSVSGFQPEDFETRQLFYTSYDNTTVPMFVVHRKGLVLTGDHPLLLYGYGGFRVSLTPFFQSDLLVFLHNLGGVYASANIRGGLEYGEDWHKEGMLGNKQNVFDDFQAAAEFLIASNYTNTEKLAIHGHSNGGLLIGACLNQKPHLFAAGVLSVGVLDMLRYQEFTIGSAWVPEYGSSDNSTQFDWLYRYSPLHNIPDATQLQGNSFPATLVMTADKDDRVVPLHSLKYTAQLQYSLGNGNTSQANPLLLRVDTDAGHGAGKPTSKRIEEKADFYSFLYKSLNLQWRD